MNVALAVMGDGAVNQGQVWESTNMAALWKLPVIFMVENNQYGMGTSTSRSSANTDYHTHGNVVPGVRCDGMDVLAVRECMRFCREWAASGKGPIYTEMTTYRYHGHSMSDPGTSYRDRDEVNTMRHNNDCIELLKQNIIEAGFATTDELKVRAVTGGGRGWAPRAHCAPFPLFATGRREGDPQGGVGRRGARQKGVRSRLRPAARGRGPGLSRSLMPPMLAAASSSPPPESELTTHVVVGHPEEVRLVERTQVVYA